MENKITLPKELIKLADLLKCKGPLFVVGGFVRNSLLKIDCSDIDICSAILPEDIFSVLDGTEFVVKDKMKKLGVVQIIAKSGLVFVHATFRTEQYPSCSGTHTPSSVVFTTDIRADAKRRDFTINSIYYDILRGQIIDIYSGVLDIEKRVLRCIETPSKVFEHDGDRILRLVRFACELNFKIDWATKVFAKKMSYYLRDINEGRKAIELISIMNSPNKYPISNKNAFLRGLKLFNKFNVWTNMGVPVTKLKYDMVKKVLPEHRFYGLLIDIINAVNPDCVEYYLRHLISGKGVNVSAKKLNNIINIVCGYFDALNKLGNKKYFSRYFENFDIISQIIRKKSEFLYKKYIFFYKYSINHNLAVKITDLNFTKEDLKIKFPKLPESKYNKILSDLLSKVYEGDIENKYSELLKEIKENVSTGYY